MQSDIHIIFEYLILLLLVLVLAFIMTKKFEVSVIIYGLTSWIAAMFFTNEENWINTELETGIQGYLRAGLLIIIGLVGYYRYFINWRKNGLKIPTHLLILGIFLIYSLLSIFYSIDPRYTLVRVSIFIFTFGFFLAFDDWLDSRKSFENIFNLIFYLFLSIFLINIIVSLALPSRVWWWQEPDRFIGIGTHPAELGSMFMLFYPIILWKIFKVNRNQKILLFILILSVFIVHFLTGSRTTLGASIVGYFIWLLLNKKWVNLLISSIVAIFLISTITIVLPSSMKRDEGQGILFLSSREMIWEGAQKLFWEKPIFGFGYRVEAKIFENQKLYDISDKFFIASAQQPLHSGYLSIAIGGGLVGLFLWLLALLWPIAKTLRSKIDSPKSILIVIMISVLITNITETALTGYQGITDLFFWISWIMAGKIWKFDTEEKTISQINL